MRDTSIDADGLLEELGIKAERERLIFGLFLNLREAMTRGEVANHLCLPAGSVTSAIWNLVKRRLLVETRRRRCAVSGFNCWELAVNPWQRQLALDLGDAEHLGGPAP